MVGNLLLILSFVPSVQLALMSFYAGEVHRYFGRWPNAMSDNTTGAYYTRLCMIADHGFDIMIACSFLWFIVLALLVGRRDYSVRKCVSIFATGMAGVFLLFLTNPHGFIDWYID